jgi:hypothetical protein
MDRGYTPEMIPLTNALRSVCIIGFSESFIDPEAVKRCLHQSTDQFCGLLQISIINQPLAQQRIPKEPRSSGSIAVVRRVRWVLGRTTRDSIGSPEALRVEQCLSNQALSPLFGWNACPKREKGCLIITSVVRDP